MKRSCALLALFCVSGCLSNKEVSSIVNEQRSAIATLPDPTEISAPTCVDMRGEHDAVSSVCVNTKISLRATTIAIQNFFDISVLINLLKTAQENYDTPPDATQVQLTVTFTNASGIPITYMHGSDLADLEFEVAGPGYIHPFKIPNRNFTTDFNAGTAVVLSVPGGEDLLSSTTETYDRLRAGFRNSSTWSYLLREGTYRLRVTGQIRVSAFPVICVDPGPGDDASSPEFGCHVTGPDFALPVTSNSVDVTTSYPISF